jgi:alpha-2-macroglobulin
LYEHLNPRDQRVEAFSSPLWDGIHPYTCVARATTPHDFVVSPARAEELHSPEVFGRSSTDRVVVR